ncbi:hypothetical protein ACVQK1_06900 [Edwardsiella tarda]
MLNNPIFFCFAKIYNVIRCVVLKFARFFFIRYFYIKRSKPGNHKTVLISFIIHPFFLREKKSHPNVLELNHIIDAFLNIGYNITVVDYRRRKVFGKYNLAFGFGDCFEFVIKNKVAKNCILYATGYPSCIQNKNTLEALGRFKKGNTIEDINLLNKSVRLTENIWPIQLVNSDAIISIGNCYIKSLFERFNKNVYNIPSICFDLGVEEDIAYTNIEPNSFIWFGGKGCIHKGLDLCIDAFIDSGCKLYIAGPLDDEIEIFRDVLTKYKKNFEYLGFLPINTDKFHFLAKKIPFVILPSCSEAMATSIVTLAYNFGTIPIISKECGIDFHTDMIKIESLTLLSVKKAIFTAIKLNNEDIIKKRKSIRHYFLNRHNDNEFIKQFRRSLTAAIKV